MFRTPVTRREAMRQLTLGALGTVGLTAWQPQGRAQSAGTQPNFLFIYTDDQRWDALSCMGHPWLKTPNLDRIRNEGCLFQNAFVTTSLCSPSRACFLTGTYAHTNGVIGNEKQEYDPDVTPSFAQYMQKAGYETAYVGKWHMAPKSDPRPGFDYWLSFKGQGVYTNPVLNENGREFKAEGYMTDLLTDYAVQYLKREHSRPFCMVLSHKAVHGPFEPAPRHADAYPGAEIEKPVSFDDTFRGKPRWMRSGQSFGNRVRSSQVGREVPEELPLQKWDPKSPGRLNYYRAINAVDDGVGRVLQVLEETGRLENTVVVFSSDNGFFHGEHRRGDKRLMYEESLRIPMLMRYPKLVKAGSSLPQMVLNIDLAPTFLELAGIAVPSHMQGRSWVPLFSESNPEWRKSFLYEYWVDLTPRIPRMVGVRTEQWKYVEYPDIDDLPEMYDLKSDPHEMRNLAEDPAHAAKRRELEAELRRLMAETNYRSHAEAESQTTSKDGELVLAFSGAGIDGKTLKDTSGKGNHGSVVGVKTAPGRNGAAALAFTGAEHVDVPNSESLNFARRSWTVEAWVKPDKDGVVLARGGQSRGYILFVDNGIPSFGVREGSSIHIAEGRETCIGKWTHIAGVIRGRRVEIYVNGEYIDSLMLFHPVSSDPNEPMQIGKDTATPVDDKISGSAYQGLIGDIRIHSRALAKDELRAAAAE